MNSPPVKLRSTLIILVFIGEFTLSPVSHAQGDSAFLANTGKITSAVDAKGVRHRSDDYREGPPWLDDRVQAFAPDYPYADKKQRHEGVGLFRLALNVKTGVVEGITVLRTTGYNTLDNSAVASFRRWRWKPGKWKQVDVPVTFAVSSSPLPPGSVRLPRPKY